MKSILIHGVPICVVLLAAQNFIGRTFLSLDLDTNHCILYTIKSMTCKHVDTTLCSAEFCRKIDTLEHERYEWNVGNFYSNRIIPILEKSSGIDASCDKGFLGYIYPNDSIFRSDINKWRIYFHCP